MKGNEIELGMILDGPDGDGAYKVVDEGNYKMDGEVRVPIDNRWNDKWWVQKINSQEPPILWCFDHQWDNEKIFHFRNEIQT